MRITFVQAYKYCLISAVSFQVANVSLHVVDCEQATWWGSSQERTFPTYFYCIRFGQGALQNAIIVGTTRALFGRRVSNDCSGQNR